VGWLLLGIVSNITRKEYFTMPKTIIEFSAEEDHELEMCQNGMRYHSVIWELQQYLRGEMKHGDLSDDNRYV
jgi:hypothetical protein